MLMSGSMQMSAPENGTILRIVLVAACPLNVHFGSQSTKSKSIFRKYFYCAIYLLNIINDLIIEVLRFSCTDPLRFRGASFMFMVRLDFIGRILLYIRLW